MSKEPDKNAILIFVTFCKIRVAVTFGGRNRLGARFINEQRKTMNAELLTKLTAFSEKEIACLLGVVSDLEAAATIVLKKE